MMIAIIYTVGVLLLCALPTEQVEELNQIINHGKI